MVFNNINHLFVHERWTKEYFSQEDLLSKGELIENFEDNDENDEEEEIDEENEEPNDMRQRAVEFNESDQNEEQKSSDNISDESERKDSREVPTEIYRVSADDDDYTVVDLSYCSDKNAAEQILEHSNRLTAERKV